MKYFVFFVILLNSFLLNAEEVRGLSADNWNTEIRLWTKDKAELYKQQKENRTSEEAAGKSEFEQNFGNALNTVDKYGSSAGLPDSVMDKVSSVAYGYNLYMNDEIEGFLYQKTIGFVLGDNIKYFNMCYTKKEPKGGSYIDPCDFLLLPDLDPCKSLPEIAGYDKIDVSASKRRDMLKETTGGDVDITGYSPEMLIKMCQKKLKKSKPNPNEKTSTAEKIINADPVSSRENKKNAKNNLHVQDVVKNSNVTSKSTLKDIQIVTKNTDASASNINPLAQLATINSKENEEAYSYIQDLAVNTALEGGTKEDIQRNIILLAKNPTKVNVTFENDLQYEAGREAITSDLFSIGLSVDDYTAALKKVERDVGSKNPFLTTSEINEIRNNTINNYKEKLKEWVDEQIGYYLAFEKKGIVSPTKDYIDNAVAGSKNELISRMSLVQRIKKQTNEEARAIADIKLRGQKKYRRFLADLERTIIAAKPFDINAARKAAGLKPYPSGDPSQAVTQMMTDVATEEMTKYTEQIIKTGGF